MARNHRQIISRGLRRMETTQLSNLLFDGKGEIELNRRLCYQINNQGSLARVEYSVPKAKGSRTHTDIVIFDAHFRPGACIECKSCITPDIFAYIDKKIINNNFERLRKDTEKYRSSKGGIPLFLIMWTIHWKQFNFLELRETYHLKYFPLHEKMHRRGFDLGEIKSTIKMLFLKNDLGQVFDQVILEDESKWLDSQATLIATVSHFA